MTHELLTGLIWLSDNLQDSQYQYHDVYYTTMEKITKEKVVYTDCKNI